ncbi:bifunctional diguanylate cyclase/phosphodiesterase [Paenibacillus sp. J2TS4]|uniref:putative bifunctional diguanylate cyclase/phosphodiesterase n=1 Tax=Paenibacillus sp. J2TS4 TaxID=2807194 RepID=UPI001B23D882|nr:EAL domain-containing protein [Paenibacillus sp. J2TS4]GIP35840.1 hypothetical protein J2TS4_50500 [Paenibacillus sp. J2TS4]
MIHKSERMFSLGHVFVPIVLISLYFNYRQASILVIALLAILWCLLLIFQAFYQKKLHNHLTKGFYWIYLLIDSVFCTAIFTIPSWQGQYEPTWIVLLLVPLYAFEFGVASSVLFSLLSTMNIVIYHLSQNSDFWSLNTILTFLGMILFVIFIGRSTDRLNRMAFSDWLTMLPNRARFKQQLVHAIRDNRKLRRYIGVLFLDLDRFKYINDTMGHAAGDELLVTVAERIKKEMPAEALLARMGGDEFALLLPNMKHPDEAAHVSELIIQAFQQSIPLHHREVFITTSIGIALYPDDGTDPETLMKNADTAMYRAKDQGRNNYQFYTPPVDTGGIERIQMETMLRHALERDELVVNYQPRIDIRSGGLVCVEALVRWKHPELGMIPPKDFIPLAEDTGLVVPLGEQILRKACTQCKQWLNTELPPFRMSVNLSPRQFRQKDLPKTIAKVLRDTKLSPEHLELEITESAAMEDVTYAEHMLRELKEMKLTIAIDDFGTGYSSLSYLKRFPIDVVKIDRTFISGIHKNADDAAIVKAIIALAHTLKLNVTAEGVETYEQYDYLKQLNCDEVQGYLIGKPMTAQTFMDWYLFELNYKVSK